MPIIQRIEVRCDLMGFWLFCFMEKIVFDGDEFFKIPNYDKYYASKKGEIFSLNINGLRKKQLDKDGYEVISLWLNGKIKTEKIHYLVMLTFIGERKKGYEINHLDFNRSNNCLDNLEYSTRVQNLKHSDCNKKRIPIFEYDLMGNFVIRHNSISHAGASVGISSSAIYQQLKGKIKTVKGRIFSLEKHEKISPAIRGNNRPILMYDINMNLLKRFDRVIDAAKYCNVGHTYIRNSCLKVPNMRKMKSLIFEYEV